MPHESNQQYGTVLIGHMTKTMLNICNKLQITAWKITSPPSFRKVMV